jgi:hypothetical protein
MTVTSSTKPFLPKSRAASAGGPMFYADEIGRTALSAAKRAPTVHAFERDSRDPVLEPQARNATELAFVVRDKDQLASPFNSPPSRRSCAARASRTSR